MKSIWVGVMMVAVALGLAAGTAQATDTNWQFQYYTGSWTTASNWTNGLPLAGSSNTANIYNGGTATISGTGVYAGAIYLGAGTPYITTSGGNILQTSGTLTATSINFNAGATPPSYTVPNNATYTISGGLFTTSYDITMQGAFFGSGSNTFTQAGGTVAVSNLRLMMYSGSAAYNLINGRLSASVLKVGGQGSNIFNQTGGQVIGSPVLSGTALTGSADVFMSVGPGPGRAAYNLTGPGQVASSLLYVNNSGSFVQTSGSVMVNSLTVSGLYSYSGGSLTPIYGWVVAGAMDFGGATCAVTPSNAVVDFSKGTITNGSHTSFYSGPQSLVIVPSGFNTGVFGGGWHPGNLVHIAGTDLNVTAGQSFTGWGDINDQLTCTSTIDAVVLADGSSRGLNLNNGVIVNSGGWVNLRSDYNQNPNAYYGGVLSVHDATSGVSAGGTLIAGYEYIGTAAGAGTFTQSGGLNAPGETFPNFTEVMIHSAGTYPGLYLGNATKQGSYYLSGTGSLSTPYIGLGYDGPGLFVQSGGACYITSNETLHNYLFVGEGYTSTYQLSGGLLDAYSLGGYGTQVGNGSFIHTGGIHNAYYLGLGIFNNTGVSSYTMSPGAVLNVYDGEGIGGNRNATFTQNGGMHTVIATESGVTNAGMVVGGLYSNITSLYQLNSGSLTVSSFLCLGGNGSNTFTQAGGSAAITWDLRVAGNKDGTDRATSGMLGTFNLGGGVFSAGAEKVGHYGVGSFNHTAGSNTVSSTLFLGDDSNGNGTYNLSGGASQLAAASLVVSNSGTGTFVQSGGTVTVSGDVVLGQSSTGSGVCVLSGGSFTAGNLIVGNDSDSVHGKGLLTTTSAAPVITLTNSLYLGQNGALNLAAGTTIHMAGSGFGNMSQSPSNFATLTNLTLIFEGGPGVLDTFEVGGKDLGTGSGSAVNNYTLGTLQLGGSRAGRVQLVNQVVNQTLSSSTEVLYVNNLIIGNGSYLDLNHLKVYYGTLTNNGGTINLNGGSLIPLNNSSTYSGTETMPGGTIILSSSGPYFYGQVITVTASAQAGYVFSGWSVTAPCTLSNSAATSTSLTVNESFTLTASFTLNAFTLTMSASPLAGGMVMVSPSQATYTASSVVTITATANPGFTFASWTATGGTLGNASSGSTTLTVTGNVTLAALFTENSYSSTETVTDGTIIVSNSGPYVWGQVITVTASAQAGYFFSGWSLSGSCVLGDTAAASTTLTVYGDFTLTANFTALPYTITTQFSPAGTGLVLVTPSQATYHYGDVVTIQGSASPGYQFVSWQVTGGTVDSTSTSQATLTIQGDVTLTAAFAGAVLVTIDPSSVTWNDATHLMTVQVNFTSSNGNTGNAIDFGAELYLTGTDAGAFSGASSRIRSKTGTQLAGLITGTFAFAAWDGKSSGMNETDPVGVDFTFVDYSWTHPVDLTTIAPGEVVAIYYFSYTGSHSAFTQVQAHLCSTGMSDDTLPGVIDLDNDGALPVAATNNGVNLIPGPLTVTAATSAWVYQNTAGTTQDRHVVALTVSVTGDTFGNQSYTTTVTQTGPGVVTPTQSWTSGVLATPATTAVWSVPVGGNLSGYLVGGRVSGPVNGSANLALTGSCTVTVNVAGNVGGTATATVAITVRPLGGIDGTGPASANDLTILDNCLNGQAIAPQTDAACDLTGDGAVTTADRVLLNLVLNGLATP